MRSNSRVGKHFQDICICKVLIGLEDLKMDDAASSKRPFQHETCHLRCQILCLWCFRSSVIDVSLLFIFERARGSAKLTTVPSQISPPQKRHNL